MWGNRRREKPALDTMVGRQTTVQGDVGFSGRLHVDGTIKGNVTADAGSSSLLTMSEHGTIEGNVAVPSIVLNGVVTGDVRAAEHIELAPRARVTGNVYYNLLEMAMGAEVNGNLVHQSEAEAAAVASQAPEEQAES